MSRHSAKDRVGVTVGRAQIDPDVSLQSSPCECDAGRVREYPYAIANGG